ncbi:MAG: permease [Oscillospiraceae bacterium]
METIKRGWDFFQNEILGMRWLDRLIGSLLRGLGVDNSGRLGASLQFFLYDTVKIMVLLLVLILLISYIQSYFPPERTKRILGRSKGIWANSAAALLGTVTPFCSCSSIPLFIGFTSAGLPLGVTFSFLISSPMVDLGSLILLTGIFGWKVAAVYVGLGLVIAVAGGTLIGKLHLEDQVEAFVRKAPSADGTWEKLSQRDRIRYAWEQAASTARKVAPYVLIGVGIGAVIHNWIPEELVVTLLGNKNPLGVVLAVLVGIPMYADIFGTIPIAEALLAKGALLGVVLAFMMGVTTLSLPSLVLLRKAVKPKLLALFIAICTVGIVLLGYFFNFIQPMIFS